MIQNFRKLPYILKIFVIALLISIIFGFFLLYDIDQRNEFDQSFIIFLITSISFHFFICISILSLNRLGFLLFKFYLYILFFFIPIGTIISYKMLQYIETKKLEHMYI